MSILASSLALGSADYSWRNNAVCKDTDPELFFPIGTTGQALLQIAKAKSVCCQCEVASHCLEFALETNQDTGIWGGTSEEERRQMRRDAAAEAKRRRMAANQVAAQKVAAAAAAAAEARAAEQDDFDDLDLAQ